MIRAVCDLSTLFEQFYKPARLLYRSHAHVVQIRLSISRFKDYIVAAAVAAGLPAENAGTVDVAEISDEMIDGFKAWRHATGVKAPTLNKDLRNLRLLLRFAAERKKRGETLIFRFEPEMVDPPEAFWPDELRRFFSSCALETGMIGDTGIPANLYWPALGAAIYSTAARVGVVMKTPLVNLDLDHGYLRLWAAANKQRKGQMIGLHPETVAALRRIVREPRELVFPWPYDKGGASWPTLIRHLRRILERAGLPTDRKHLFHCLRRTTATRMTAAGGIEKAREQMGHSTQKVSFRYVDQRQTPQITSRELIEPPPIADRQVGARQMLLGIELPTPPKAEKGASGGR